MKVFVLAGFAESLVNFRIDLLKGMRELGHEVTCCAPENSDRVQNQLSAIGIKYIPINLKRANISLLSDFFYLFRLRSVLKSEKPDILFTYTIKPNVYGGIICRTLNGIRHFAMVTGLGYGLENTSKSKPYLFWIIRKLFQEGIRRTKVVFFQNCDDLEFFKDTGIMPPDRPVALLPGSGVNLDYFKVQPKTTNSFVCLFIGRLISDKGIVEFCKAASNVLATGAKVKFQILGPFDSNPTGITREKFYDLIQDTGIEYLGETNDVRPYLAECDVFVLPSYREGTPRTALEAMSMGRAVITTDVPGCRETVLPGITGLLIPSKNISELSDAILKLYHDPETTKSMGIQGRSFAAKKFDVHKVNQIIFRNLGI